MKEYINNILFTAVLITVIVVAGILALAPVEFNGEIGVGGEFRYASPQLAGSAPVGNNTGNITAVTAPSGEAVNLSVNSVTLKGEFGVPAYMLWNMGARP